MSTSNYMTRNLGYSVRPFHPFAELERELGRFFGSPLTPATTAAVSAPIDARETADHLSVAVDLPGVRREDIQIAFDDGVLTLSAERKGETSTSQEGYLLQERHVGRIERRVVVRTPVQVDGIRATYRDGVLTVTLPKSEAAKPKQISVSE